MTLFVTMDFGFGAWLADKRGRRGEPGFVSQRELARRMSVDATYISQLEKRHGPPSYETRQRIHDALGTTDDELIGLGIVPGRTGRLEPVPPFGTAADPLAALIATFTARQRRMLIDLLDGAMRSEGEAPPEEERRQRQS